MRNKFRVVLILLYAGPLLTQTGTIAKTDTAPTPTTPAASTPTPAPLPRTRLGASVAAFPGAQGGGAASAGGRGGVVMEVTTTADSGPGSLRACATASGPRTCIFRVAGLFPTASEIQVNNPFLTIACQSAPGEVILGGPTSQGVLRISTHDTIVRYCTFSPDNPGIASGPSTGTVGYSIINAQAYNNIADHITSRWAGNKEWIAYSGFPGEFSRDSTLQYSLIYEPHEGHPVGPSTSENDTESMTQASSNYDSHHNLLVNIDHRIPEYNNPTMRWINNYTYNYSGYAVEALGATQSDIIGNVWDYQNLVPSQTYPIHSSDGNWKGSLPGTPSFYIAGNIGHGHTTPNSDQIADLTYQITGENGNEINGPFPASWLRSAPLPASNAFPIQVDPAVNLLAILAPTVGNSQHLDCNGNWVNHRDPEDTRIIQQVQTHGPGGFWPNGVTFTGQASFPAPTTNWTDHPQTIGFTACVESLRDGIPDQWKKLKGLSTRNRKLYKTVAPNGFTWLENYLNGQ
jgi:pectate lyase